VTDRHPAAGPGGPADEDLMLRAGRGDEPAFEELVLRHQGDLAAFIRRFTGDAGRAEDLAQETFVKVYLAAARYEPRAKFRTYLYTVARNLCLDAAKKTGRRPSEVSLDAPVGRSDDGVGLADLLGGPAPKGLPDEDSDLIERALARLDDKHRDVVVLSVYQEFKYQEIAEVLGISEGTVASRKNAAMRKLREILTRLDAEKADAMRRGR